MSGRGENVVASLTVGGLLSGTFYLFGVPRFEANSGGSPGGILRLDAAGFTFKTNSPLTRVAVGMFRARIERALQGAAWWDVSPELQAAAAQFGGVLNRDISSQARLSGRLTRFGPGEVRVGPQGLEAWYQLGGKVEVVVTPFD